MKEFSRCLYDVETNGLLPEHVDPPFCMDRIHSMGIRCLDTGRKRSFVNDALLPLAQEDIDALAALGHTDIGPLSEGVGILEEADYVTGHNIIDFDENAILIEYDDYQRTGNLVDTLVMSRMVFADIKDTDFRMVAKGTLQGKYIGMHGLEAWGQRLGLAKGDYKHEREAELKARHKDAGQEPPTDEELHHYVWGTWNVSMHDYMMRDIDVNFMLWEKIQEFAWSRESVILEHSIHALMVQQERNGFLFDIEGAEKLTDILRVQYDDFTGVAVEQIGVWYRPAKIIRDAFLSENGENDSRRTWGEVSEAKRSVKFAASNAKVIASGDYSSLRADRVEGAPFVVIELKEFNPNSRQQITERLQTLYGWEPQDFTEKGQAKVDDEILRNLSETVPIAETLAELFFLKKRLGMLADGKNGWLKLVRKDGRIHGRVNVGGAVTGRATHSAPNISQVPGVTAVEFKDEAKGRAFLDSLPEFTDTGRKTLVKAKWNEKKGEWKILTRGRSGGYGWDSRELFIVPKGYTLVGCDLSGIEFRCLGHLTFPFDNGEIVDVVLNGDIHQQNADLTGISRSLAKRLLYACLYGGGDAKLGSIIEPFASEPRQKTLGGQARIKLMNAMPSLKAAMKAIKREARANRGTIAGLDGRRLYVRSDHAALNLRLQSDGALIAKKWLLIIDDLFYQEGWDHGNGLDYAMNSWSHDETQIAVRDELAPRAAELMIEAARLAGEYFKLNVPVAAEAKLGHTWATTH